MNYQEQQQYLRASRAWAILIVLLLLGTTFALWTPFLPPYWRLCYALVVSAMAASILYTPDYLHLTVNREKPRRWQIKIRWRIIAAVLVLGLIPARSVWSAVGVLGAVFWLSAINLGASLAIKGGAKRWHRMLPAFLWIGDYVAITALAFILQSFVFEGVLLALACHLAIVGHSKRVFLAATLYSICSIWPFFVFASAMDTFVMAKDGIARLNFITWTLGIPLVLTSTFGTAFLVYRAQRRNRANVSTALSELKQFTGYSEARVRELWATSDRQLAANWQAAKLEGATPEQLAAWYRDNSELYLFAISAYNLDYKRIVSNLGVLRLARGRTLDYGAGNGELLLELARRGQAVAYYDVEGMTMRFARYRAEQRGVNIQFFAKKSELAAAAASPITAIPRDGGDPGDHPGFDTIFSFDVLEHLPDLAGELTFLASLLAPGGQFVFDIPAGATRNHPMHLDHQLDFIAHLRSLCLEQVLTWRDRLPWRKEEKYRFRRPN